MIRLKRLNGKEVVVNCDFIEFIESTPDTVVTLVAGNKLVVCETIDEVIGKVVEYKQKVYSRLKIKKEEIVLETYDEKFKD